MELDEQDITKESSNNLPSEPIDEDIEDSSPERHDEEDLQDTCSALETQDNAENTDTSTQESVASHDADLDVDVPSINQNDNQDHQGHEYRSPCIEDESKEDSRKTEQSSTINHDSPKATTLDDNAASGIGPNSIQASSVDDLWANIEAPEEFPFFEGLEPSYEDQQDIQELFGSLSPARVIDYGSSTEDSSDNPPTEEAGNFMLYAEKLSKKTPLERDETPVGLSPGIELHEHQKIALHWLKDREDNPVLRGGILADDMGLGKTVELIALMVSRPFEKPPPRPSIFARFDEMDAARLASVKNANDMECNGTTLIVAPSSLLRQWDKEIRDKTSHMFKPWLFERKASFSSISFHNLPVVLISYESLAKDFDRSKKGKKTLFFDRQSFFYRVILDEAHKIKNRETLMSQACRELNAKYRWYVSGTPIQNGIQELYPATSFLRVVPLDQEDVFERDIMKVPMASAIATLHPVLRKYMLRRTKNSIIDNKPILTLPEKVQTYEYPIFDEAQQDAYSSLEKETKRLYKKYKLDGNHDHTFKPALLLRLRQISLHPWLINFTLGDSLHRVFLSEQRLVRNAAYNFNVEQINHILDRLKAAQETGDDLKCEQCEENSVARLIPGCGHGLCCHCFVDISPTLTELEELGEPQGECPVCQRPYEKLFITTMIAFKCAWWPGFRRDSWDENYLEDAPAFDRDSCFEPLTIELESDLEGRTHEKRAVDARIWGIDNVSSLREYLEDDDLSFVVDDDDADSFLSVNEQHPESLLKRKASDHPERSSAEIDTSHDGIAPRKRHCGGERSSEVDTIQSHEIEEESLFVEGDITEIGYHVDNNTTPSTTCSSVGVSEDSATLTGHTSPSSVKQESDSQAGTSDQRMIDNLTQDTALNANMEDVVELPTNQQELGVSVSGAGEGTMRGPSGLKDAIITKSPGNPVPPPVPVFELRVKHGEFDLPLNHHRLKKQANRSDEDKRRYLARLQEEQLPECTKISYLMALLNRKHAEFPEDRIIIFSEFTTMLDFVEAMFSQLGKTNYIRYDGTITAEQKHSVVKKFMDTSNEIRILLCSLRSGNVGLNLTAANHVIFMEPCWNPYVEDQAVDRCHRIGQTKPVQVTRLIVPNTIEARIIAIQEVKRRVVGEIIDGEVALAAGRNLTEKDFDFLFGIGGSTQGSNHSQQDVNLPPDPTI